MSGPLFIEVFDRQFNQVGVISRPLWVTCTRRHNVLSTGAFAIPTDHHLFRHLAQDGKGRVVFRYARADDTFLMSGPTELLTVDGPSGSATFQVSDDWRILQNIRGWPNPGLAIADQADSDDALDVHTGPAEDVGKAIIRANLAHSSLPVTVEADGHRGDIITVSLRMQPIADQLFPAATNAGVGFRVRQQGAGLRVSVYQPAAASRVLTQKSGILAGAPSWSRRGPDATRVVVGGGGTGTDRIWVEVIDHDLEALWHDEIHDWIDGGSVTDPAELVKLGQQRLAEKAPTSSLQVQLSETPHFRYGKAVREGDRYLFAPTDAPEPIEAVLSEATVTWTPEDTSSDSGLRVTLTAGDMSDDPDKDLALTIDNLNRRVANMEVSR